ncbi:MAG: fibronectin type III domain-containing protein, partial [candidate division Zixibacteria bacterium]|nr:fibronectin type III domain-containing protein [candidate division Zixibacteria bacterium]
MLEPGGKRMSPGFLRTTLLCLTLIFASCGDDSAVNNVDTVPPAAIGDLLAQCRSDGVVTLIWTASGDDGMSGTASRYKIGYSVERIGSGNFDQVPLLSGPPSPKAAGRIDAVDISGLYPDAVYYFAIKVIDEAGNQSGLSNTVHLRASPNADTTPPATITDLQVTAVTEQSVALAWTATG